MKPIKIFKESLFANYTTEQFCNLVSFCYLNDYPSNDTSANASFNVWKFRNLNALKSILEVIHILNKSKNESFHINQITPFLNNYDHEYEGCSLLVNIFNNKVAEFESNELANLKDFLSTIPGGIYPFNDETNLKFKENYGWIILGLFPHIKLLRNFEYINFNIYEQGNDPYNIGSISIFKKYQIRSKLDVVTLHDFLQFISTQDNYLDYQEVWRKIIELE